MIKFKTILLSAIILCPAYVLAAETATEAAKASLSPEAAKEVEAALEAAEAAGPLNNNTGEEGKGYPFGGNLFSSTALTGSKEPLNPNYQIVPGDMVDVQAYGAINYSSSTAVDNQGNIFLPEVGPINVLGINQSELNETVANKVGQVYKDNVKVYATLRGSLPVSVFVSGAVGAPGRYVGTSTDSVLDYIHKAGGIDSERGSYRRISVVRNNAVIEEFDIYDFLMNGNMQKFQIREGDTILVKQRGKVVNVKGDVKNPYMFEFKEDEIKGEYVTQYAGPLAGATNVVISGTREGKPFKSYITLDKLSDEKLSDGDMLEFSPGTHEDKIAVNITGRHQGPKVMVLPLDAKLSEVLNNIPVDNNVSNVNAVYIKRKSVAEKQKLAIKDSVKRLQETLLLARASGSTGESPIGEGEVLLLQSFVDRVETTEPEGRVVFNSEKDYSSVILEEGDEVVIPQKSNLVMVNGEVILPKAIVWEEGLSVGDYVEKAGGFSQNANSDEIVVVRNNGDTAVGSGTKIKPGDEIMILPEVKLNSLEVTATVAEILYKVAVAAAIPFRL